MATPADITVCLTGDEARVLHELSGEMDVESPEVLRRAIRLLGIMYSLHSRVHGVVRPVGDPRA